MARDGERSRTPAGRTRAEASAADDLEPPTDQGPGDEETGDLPPERSPSVSNVDPTVSAPTPSVLDEQELPKREPPPKNVHEGRTIAPDPEVGEVVGDYQLLSQLGKGGAGSVFRARNRTTGQLVALKVLAASKTKRARIVQRFFDEVRAASAVKHPGLIRVLDFIEEEEPRRLAYAMEYVDGESLRERLKRDGTLDLREAIHIGAEVADALAALHDAGIIHRDLKPENIMVLRAAPGTMPKVKLLDFGVVKFLPVDKTSGQVHASGDERPGTFVGTPRYMAPEQAAGGTLDARADLFAVGVLLFEMITGVCPHEGDSLRDVVLAKLKGAPRITVNPEKEILPHELTEVVDACLQLKAAQRPKDAREVARGLREASVVLFTVGAVKTDDSGVPFRLATQHAHAGGAAHAAQAHGPASVLQSAVAHGAGAAHGPGASGGGVQVTAASASSGVSITPSLGPGGHGASGGGVQVTGVSAAGEGGELPRPELPIPIAHPVRPGSHVTVRPAAVPTPAGAPASAIVVHRSGDPARGSTVTPVHAGAHGAASIRPSFAPGAGATAGDPARAGELHTSAGAQAASQAVSPAVSQARRSGGGLDPSTLRWILAILMLAMIVVLAAFLAARTMRDDQVLLVPLEAPAHDAAKTATAAHATPAPGEPRAEPVEAEPAEAEPMQAEPARVEPTKVEPAKVEPATVEPATVEPVHAQPARAEPSKVEPSRVEPSKAEPSKAEPEVPARVTKTATSG